MGRRRWGLWLALSVVLSVGAAVWLRGAAPARLLDVTGVEQQVLERGDALSILGAGFHAGREAEVRLRGTMRAPGASPRAVSAVLRGHAVNGERVEVVLDDSVYARLGQRGSYDGELEVRFAAARGKRAVSGRVAGVQLDVLPSAAAMGDEPGLRESASQVLAAAGIVPADEDTLHGLVLADVQAGGQAERAGLRAGDVLAAASGVRVHALSDLAPGKRGPVLELLVKRAGYPSPLPVSLGLGAVGSSSFVVTDARLPLMLSFVLLVLLFASPLPSPTPMLLRVVAELRAAAAPAAESTSTWRGRAGIGVLWVVCIGALPLSAAFGLSMDATTWLCAVAALSVYRSVRTPRRMLPVVSLVAMLGLLASAACLSSGSSELGMLVAQQGVAPWSWKAFTHPELLVALLLYAALSSRLLLALRAEAGGELPVRVLLSVLGAVVFLGGHAAPTLSWLGVSTAAGVLLMAAKSAALGWLLPRAAALMDTTGRVRTAVWFGAVAAGTSAWLCVDEPSLPEQLLGAVSFVTAACAAPIAYLQVRSERLRALGSHVPSQA